MATPYQRIMKAAKRRTGMRLSADEVWEMSCDEAIKAVAANDDEDDREKGEVR